MIRALVTGCEGFVGKYLRAELTEHDREVIGMDRVEAPGCRQCDLLDARSLLNLIRETRPREVYHLAGQADIGRSWKEPAKTVEINTVGAANLLEAIRKEAPEAFVQGEDEDLLRLAWKMQAKFRLPRQAPDFRHGCRASDTIQCRGQRVHLWKRRRDRSE